MSTVTSIMFKGHKWAKIRGKILGNGHRSHKCETCGALFTETSKKPVTNYAFGKRHVKGRYVYRYIPFTMEQNKAWEEVLEDSELASPEILEPFVSLILDFATCLKHCTKIKEVEGEVDLLRKKYLLEKEENLVKKPIE